MTPDRLAALHARCFVAPRPWSETEFRALLDMPGAFLLLRPDAFLLGRSIAGEAELLTLAVAPEARQRGVGRALTQDFAATLRRLGAGTDGEHRHHRAHADDDTQHGERGPELVSSQGLESHFESEKRRHSCLSASIGSIRAAESAG